MRSDQQGFKVDKRVLKGAGSVEPTFISKDNPMGSSTSGKERDHLFLSCFSKEERFADVSGVSGLDTLTDSRAFALFDYDHDGWLDIAHISANAPKLQLFQNRIGQRRADTPVLEHAFIAVKFVGGNTTNQPSEWSSRNGYGALVTVKFDGQTLIREHRCGEGLSAQNSATLLIGIGDRERVDSVTVRWPSGRTEELLDVEAGSLLTAFENRADSLDDSNFAVERYPAAVGSAARVAVIPLSDEQLSVVQATDAGVVPALTLYTTMATWCSSCLAELPELEHLRENFDGGELQMFAVPIDPADTNEALERYAEVHQPPYRQLLDLSDEEAARINELALGILEGEGLPATLVTDRDGRVLLAKWGAPTVSDLRQLLARLAE